MCCLLSSAELKHAKESLVESSEELKTHAEEQQGTLMQVRVCVDVFDCGMKDGHRAGLRWGGMVCTGLADPAYPGLGWRGLAGLCAMF